jgi:tripartite ATP-independent transporter DctM subunit
MFAGVLILTIIVMALTGLEKFPRPERATAREVLKDTIVAVPAVIMPVFVLGGIVAGITTPTEAALVSVFYTLSLGALYREMTVQRLWTAFLNTCTSTAVIMVLTGFGAVMSYVVVSSRSADVLAQAMLGISNDPLYVLLMINLFLLVLGMLIETVPAMLIAIPLLGPVAIAVGVDPIQFGILLVFNLLIGIITPPTGMGVFTISAVTGISADRVFRATFPFYVPMLVVLLSLSLFPALSLWLPSVLLAD